MKFQGVLDKLGLPYDYADQHEWFQYGPNDPVLSTRKWRYHVGVGGRTFAFEISEVSNNAPGLATPDALGEWGVTLDFGKMRLPLHQASVCPPNVRTAATRF